VNEPYHGHEDSAHEALADEDVPVRVRKTRNCINCGDAFVPWHSGQRFCGNNPDCEKEEAAMEREAFEERRESAEQDGYERY
jgi:hypothetical protein